MWQVLLAAAVAGSSGLVARHIFGYNLNPNSSSITEKSNKTDENREDREEIDCIVDSEVLIDDDKFDSPIVSNGLNASECEEIFRFSSSDSRGAARNFRKKARSRMRASAKEGGRELVMDQKKSCGRFSVCLKKRKTSKNKNIGSAKSGSCSSKDGSLFHWGLGVGMMYMMSAGKSDINKLNETVDETAKVVQELKSELYKRKSSCHMQEIKACENSKISGCNTIQHEIDKSSAEYKYSSEIKNCTLSLVDDGGCESSVLTEEPEPVTHEMDLLEAELATELKKLPWCTTIEQSYQAEVVTNLDKIMVSAIELHGPQNQSSHAYPLHGVSPAELDQKLCHLLIEQQENQIVELESELHVAQSKLNEKESELQALKDCVRRLTQFSLSTVSDDDAEAHTEKQMECEPMRSVVGMKRPVESDSWGYYV